MKFLRKLLGIKNPNEFNKRRLYYISKIGKYLKINQITWSNFALFSVDENVHNFIKNEDQLSDIEFVDKFEKLRDAQKKAKEITQGGFDCYIISSKFEVVDVYYAGESVFEEDLRVKVISI